MAPEPSEVAARELEMANEKLLEDGFFRLEDPSLGESLTEIERLRFRFHSEYGLEFGRKHVLDDRGGPKAGRRCLLVHLIGKGSQIRYRRQSHLHDLPAVENKKRSLHETSSAAYDEAGCEAEIMTFPDGGKVILDARVGYEIRQGYAIVFEFAEHGIAYGWKKMMLPGTKELRDKVQQMQSKDIRVNFAFKEVAAQQIDS
ncbi:hypothetical protein MAC_03306 [Metarhizium acridum CQMa 102]|uniref:Uncharacterized protein n=1 Tax=Metarhizium acridum (strain CQMa 102) TaxID=655827 RepID=E9E030_METAQ|nr:uncharacterized protein MAC_03306 [Metarhizium acridum CQMa 102]EFY90726.1 hypothetical protein MAC_03306 [Metarhizium acridum CQMa 102]